MFPQGISLGLQEEGAQSCSSLPSPQSSSPLQTNLRETQRPLEQVNSRGAHVMLPQLISSSPLSQSFSPSHFQKTGMHCVEPTPQLNSFTRQVRVWHISMLSSEPSSQSGSPSHCHLLGMHCPLRQTKSTSAQVFLTQDVSSLPSEQSMSPSHCHTDGIHRPFPHWN